MQEYFSGLIRDESVNYPPVLENLEQSYDIEVSPPGSAATMF